MHLYLIAQMVTQMVYIMFIAINVSQTSSVEMSIDGQVFFIQDAWSNDQGISVNLGLRAENNEHISSAVTISILLIGKLHRQSSVA